MKGDCVKFNKPMCVMTLDVILRSVMMQCGYVLLLCEHAFPPCYRGFLRSECQDAKLSAKLIVYLSNKFDFI